MHLDDARILHKCTPHKHPASTFQIQFNSVGMHMCLVGLKKATRAALVHLHFA